MALLEMLFGSLFGQMLLHITFAFLWRNPLLLLLTIVLLLSLLALGIYLTQNNWHGGDDWWRHRGNRNLVPPPLKPSPTNDLIEEVIRQSQKEFKKKKESALV